MTAVSSFPTNLTTIVVTGQYSDLYGNPLEGSVSFRVLQPITDAAGKMIFSKSPVTLRLNAQGRFSVILPCTDNANLNPTNFVYAYDENIDSLKRTFLFSIPSTLGTTVDVSALLPTTQVGPFSAYVPLAGTTATGPMTGPLILVGDPTATNQAATKHYVDAGETVVTAADTSIVVGGTAAAPTIRTNTLDVIATQHPPAAAVGMNSQKITSLANGTAATDGAAFGQIPVIDTNAGDIQKTTSVSLAGSTGKVADAGHVHMQTWENLFGDASDGTVTLDGTTTYNNFSALASNVYTLTRDVFASNMTVNNGVTLKTANYRIFCQGTLTVNSGGIVSWNGNNASGQAGGPNQGQAVFFGGRGGGSGGTGVNGAGASGGGGVFGPASGNGGAGTSGAAGSGTIPGITVAIATPFFRLPWGLLNPMFVWNNGQNILGWGSGGGGGGSDASSNAGGGAGGGAGVIAIWAYNIVNNGSIQAIGGAGANGTGGNAGGGGGGAGGLIVTYTVFIVSGSGTWLVTGGTAGTGSGTGANGVNGTAGLRLNQQLA